MRTTWLSSNSGKMIVFDQHLQPKCSSMTDILKQRWSTAAPKTATGLRRYSALHAWWERTTEDTPTLSRQNTHRGEKKWRIWFSFIFGEIKVIDQHFEQTCWSLTDIFQKMKCWSNRQQNSRELMALQHTARRERPTKQPRTPTIHEKL